MKFLSVLLVGGGIWAAYALIAGARRRGRRRLALARPFSDEWAEALRQNLPFYVKLPPEMREELQQDVKVFLAEKSFEGCGGLVITDEIRVMIAAQACLLLLNREDECYPKLRSVLVYPSTYVAGGKGHFGGGEGSRSVRLGESWGRGVVVLSWSSVKQGAFNACDGHNVAMHEFAHQLDQESGAADGAPILERRSAYSSWARVFSKEFDRLQRKARKRKRSVLDSYGATNPAEFFAVATESFFEKPAQLQKKHLELYEELRDYYKVNPIEWV
ncbi:MAG: zinc-dependent peptidase [Planctomycetes bacterium]|nr:zinc-dependent peptidase [Planctomycetota bacterium]